jgi:hypothetical protein
VQSNRCACIPPLQWTHDEKGLSALILPYFPLVRAALSVFTRHQSVSASA